FFLFFFSSRRRHTRSKRDWSSDVCSSDLEETGAAQLLRDVRIAPIYEGTNGIQALDLAGRKLSRDGGAALAALLDEVEATARDQIGRASCRERVSRSGVGVSVREKEREKR